MRIGAGLAACVLAGCSFSGAGETEPVDARRADIDSEPGTIDAPVQPPADAAPDAAVPVVCPSDYGTLAYQASRYRIPGAPATWAQAEADCEDDTDGRWTHLVAFDSTNEWDWAKDILYFLPGQEMFWIGVVRDAGDPSAAWRTVTGGEAPVLVWRGGEPNNAGAGEPVVALDSNFNFDNSPDLGGFLDQNTSTTHYYVCECDGLPPVNATY